MQGSAEWRSDDEFGFLLELGDLWCQALGLFAAQGCQRGVRYYSPSVDCCRTNDDVQKLTAVVKTYVVLGLGMSCEDDPRVRHGSICLGASRPAKPGDAEFSDGEVGRTWNQQVNVYEASPSVHSGL